ncbi:MAG: hypothetical protein ACJ8AI_07970 [Rhodopila sp.]|jgi:hypothetical protein
MSKGQVQIHVRETMEDVGARFIDAWHRMERGEEVNEKHVSFADWETMVARSPPSAWSYCGISTSARPGTSVPWHKRSAAIIGGCMRTWKPWAPRVCWNATRMACGPITTPSMCK